jgi:hypothetical protein
MGRGAAYPFEAFVSDSYLHARSATAFTNFDPALAEIISNAAATNDDVSRFAIRIAESTFCRGRRVSQNQSAGIRFTDPNDIAVIAGASAAALGQRDTIPSGVAGERLPVVERKANA